MCLRIYKTLYTEKQISRDTELPYSICFAVLTISILEEKELVELWAFATTGENERNPGCTTSP